MPVICRHIIDGAELILWNITETEEELADLVTAHDAASVWKFTSAGRRLERLAWRAALRSAGIEGEVSYDSLGAPFIEDSRLHIGVSHCRGAACVLVSPGHCAVDIERVSRDCANSAPRFLSPREREVVADYVNPECVAWCAKEALYKYSGRDGLDFLRDIVIEGRVSKCLLAAAVEGNSFGVVVFEVEGYVLAAVV